MSLPYKITWLTFRSVCVIFSAVLLMTVLSACQKPAAVVPCIHSIVFVTGETLYENPLSRAEDLEGVVLESSREGHPVITFDEGRMRLSSDVHFLLWYPDTFPDQIAISWDFLPLTDDGLAMFWFSAAGRNGEDLFDPSLQPRTGAYRQYNQGDINAYHLAYYRRNPWDDPHMNTVNLRKSYGHELVSIVPNPIPSTEHMEDPYRIKVIKHGPYIRMYINDLLVMNYKDPGEFWTDGKIGFRQMANLVAEYSNLRVESVSIHPDTFNP